MLMPWDIKRKGEVDLTKCDVTSETEIVNNANEATIPSFFLTRAIGWFAMAVMIMCGTFIWIASTTISFPGLMGGAVLAAAICAVNGANILYIGLKRKFFTLRLTCTEIRVMGLLENLPSYINPSSNTAFRGGQQVTFLTNSGTKVFFTYERARRFLVGARYDFYFNKPGNSDKITVEMLERLRIDHSIVRDELTSEDITDDVNMGGRRSNQSEGEG